VRKSRRSPLFRARVLVTRAEPRNGPLSSLLRSRGAIVVHWPAYRIAPGSTRELRAALANADRYDWIAFTSANAVQAAAACGEPPRGRTRVAAVGEATRAALREQGWPVHLKPRTASALSLARQLVKRRVGGCRVLFPHSERAAADFTDALHAAGARVDSIVAYRLLPIGRAGIARAARTAHPFDVLTFTSPSTIDGLEARIGARRVRALLDRTPAVVMGDTTARALGQRGVRAARRAKPTTLAGLVSAAEQVVAAARN
jgi:uroporphyrinogen-III synthase